jgi:hypothetical protein
MVKIFETISITCISFFLIIVFGVAISHLVTSIYNSTPRYEIYPVVWIDNIGIEGTPFKGAPFNVTIYYRLPNSCASPYSQEFEVDNSTQSVDFLLYERTCINCGCYPAIYYYNHTFSITLQLAGDWTLRAGEVSINIEVYE